jgi:hypothetical protein
MSKLCLLLLLLLAPPALLWLLLLLQGELGALLASASGTTLLPVPTFCSTSPP